jgi:hypothetical protein
VNQPGGYREQVKVGHGVEDAARLIDVLGVVQERSWGRGASGSHSPTAVVPGTEPGDCGVADEDATGAAAVEAGPPVLPAASRYQPAPNRTVCALLIDAALADLLSCM